MVSIARAFLVVAMAAAALEVALGASYTVGAPGGSWDLQTNYTRWSSSINFRAGDQLVFKYSRAAHNVLEVTRNDYVACSSSSPIATFHTGDDVVPLPSAATRYFICGVPGHCDDGMKLRVDVEAAAGGNTPRPSLPRSARPPAAAPAARDPAAGAPTSPLPSSSAVSLGLNSAASLGFVVFVGLMAMY